MDFLYHGVFYECADHWESGLTEDEHIYFVKLNVLGYLVLVELWDRGAFEIFVLHSLTINKLIL